jgi:hypothetical protein
VNPILKTLSVVGALAFTALSAAQAQNQSDFIITFVSGSPVGGSFTPGAGGSGNTRTGGPNANSVNANTVAGVDAALNSGSITSPITGAAITGAAVTNLGSLMVGSPAGVTSVSNALMRAGMPAALVGTLVQALNGLGNNPSPAAVISAAQAFNALVHSTATPASALNTPEVLAIHAALSQLLAGIGK